MLKYLAEDKEVLSAHVEVSLNVSLSDNISQGAEVVWHKCDLEQELRRQTSEPPPSLGSGVPKSTTEVSYSDCTNTSTMLFGEINYLCH